MRKWLVLLSMFFVILLLLPQIAVAEQTSETDGWAAAEADIGAAGMGDTVSVAPSDTLLPAQVLSLLKQKGCVLAVDLGSCVCTIDGRALYGVSDSPIDIGVSMEQDAALSEAARGQDLLQLHFQFGGELPGRFSYTIQARGCSPGDTLSLYCHYARAGTAERVQQALADADGFVTFTICHGQDFYVTRGQAQPAAAQAAALISETKERAGVPLPVVLSCASGTMCGAAAVWVARRRMIRRKEQV